MSTMTRRLLVIFVVLVAVVAVLVLLLRSDGEAGTGKQPIATAKQGSLTISVTEAGTVKARELAVIKSQVEGQTTILYLIPEGTRVTKGELLVELDTSSLEDRKVEQEIQVKNSQTSFVRARENLEVVRKQTESDIALATRDQRFAQEDLSQYVDGEFPKLLTEANSRITLEKEELENAIEKLKWSDTLLDEKYISESERETDRLAMNRARLDHELAVANRDLLQNYTYKRNVDKLQSDIEETARALERVQLKASSDIVQAEADLENRETELVRQRAKLTKIVDQIGKAKITSPGSGMVVYASSSRASWRGNDEPLDEGQSVRERQELIHLPTTDAIMVELKVHESNLDKISLGLAVRVRVDAIPGRVFTGKMAKIAPLPDAQSMWMNPDLKVYRSEVHIDEAEEALRTGMSCQVEILIDHYEDAVFVPIQCVVRSRGQPLVYVENDSGFEARPVKLGRDNNRVVVITSGLAAGTRVSLAPPLDEEFDDRAVSDEAAAETESVKSAIESAKAKQAEQTEASPASAGPGADEVRDRPPRGEGAGRRGEGRRGQGGQSRMGDMTPEERQKMRERFEKMTPEEKAKLREQWGGGRGGERQGGERRGGRGNQRDGGSGQ